MFLVILFFWIKGKNWREQFEIESANRKLHKWEFLLLGIVSIFMTLYSFGLQKLPAIDNYTTNVFNYIKICLVADAYDAMTSNRSYRDLLSQEIVRGEIEKGKGSQFDPKIADIMLTIIDEDKNYILHE